MWRVQNDETGTKLARKTRTRRSDNLNKIEGNYKVRITSLNMIVQLTGREGSAYTRGHHCETGEAF